MAGGEVSGQGVDDCPDRVVAALFEGAEDGHQDGLAVGTVLAAIAVAVFADDHRRADGPLGRVVVERNVRLIQKREQFVSMTPESFDQSFGVRVLPGRVDQLFQTRGQPLASRRSS